MQSAKLKTATTLIRQGLLVSGLLVCGTVQASVTVFNSVIISFDDLQNGQIIGGIGPANPNHANYQQYTSQGITFSIENFGSGPDLGVIFDTEDPNNGLGNNPGDPDLVGPGAGAPWDGGNLSSPQTDVGNILIIQEHGVETGPDASGNYFISTAPDDQGSGGGTITIDLTTPASAFGFDWIDAEEAGYTLEFSDGVNTHLINFSDFSDAGSIFYQGPDFVEGDHFANRILPIGVSEMQAEGYLGTDFNQVVFTLTGSGGFDHMLFGLDQNLPEPATALLFTSGLFWLGRRRRH